MSRTLTCPTCGHRGLSTPYRPRIRDTARCAACGYAGEIRTVLNPGLAVRQPHGEPGEAGRGAAFRTA